MKVNLLEGVSLSELLMVTAWARTDEREQHEAFSGRPYDYEDFAAELHLRHGPRWLLATEDGPVAAAGFTMIRPGVWQDWMVSTDSAWVPGTWQGVTRHARRVMDLMLQGGAHRLQCVSLASRIHAHRWYRPLGLEQEGVLHAYGVNGEDAIMFYRLRTPHGQ